MKSRPCRSEANGPRFQDDNRYLTNDYLKVLGRGARFQDDNRYLHISATRFQDDNRYLYISATCPIPPEACARQSKGSESLKTT